MPLSNMEIIEQLQKNPKKVFDEVTADQLASALDVANEKYRNENEQLLSDALYDLAFEHLEKIAPTHPFLTKVGAPAKGEKVKLPYWTGSLDKIKDAPKVIDKWQTTYPGPYVLSDKLDGNSGLLVTHPNGAHQLFSRGDGEYGQDLSNVLKYIKIPKINQTCAVRGELIISKKNWDKIKHLGANARNVVAGALHASEPNKEIANKIDFVVYELIYPKLKPSDQMKFVQDAGFNTVYYKTQDAISLEVLSQLLMTRRNESPYEIDGIVVYQDQEHKLIKGKNPKYAFAFKSIHTQEEAEVTVEYIEWNISKDGLIKPTVKFPSVTIGGVRIQRATGFNAKFIKDNKIGPGARLIIIRSGDVIPHIVRVLTPASNEQGALPDDMEYEWTPTNTDIMIKDKTDNKEIQIKIMEAFASKLEIPYIGPGTVAKLYESGIHTLPQLMHMKLEDVMKVEGFQKTSAEKLIKALKKVREDSICLELMAATNIFGRGLGSRRIEPIIKMYPQILNGEMITLDQVTQVEGIAKKTGEAFLEGLPKFFALIREMDIPCRSEKPKPAKQAPAPVEKKDEGGPSRIPGQQQQQQQRAKAEKSLKDMIIVFTGFRNKEWEERIKEEGGEVIPSITKKTTLLVAVDTTEKTGKIQKAEDLGIAVISKEDFEKQYFPAKAPKKSLKDMAIIFTGFRNKDWEDRIKEGGGRVVTSVSKNTTLVVAADPDDNTGKIAKAKELGITIISKEEFEKQYI